MSLPSVLSPVSRVELTDSAKHSSLPRYVIIYGHKKFSYIWKIVYNDETYDFSL